MTRQQHISIWDLDNCLADDAWRIPRIDWSAACPGARYAAYHAAAGEDACAVRNAALFKAWRAFGTAPVFATGRPEAIRRDTEDWIERHLGMRPTRDALFMRGDTDHRPSVVLKREMLSLIRATYPAAHIALAFDDHPGIVDMYRAEGVAALHLQIHSVDAYNPPPVAATRQQRSPAL
jgi:hypothetical protein